MKYSINHVLRGIAITRTEQALAANRLLHDKAQELQAAKQRRAGAPGKLAALLREQSDRVEDSWSARREDFQEVQNAVTKLERSTPTQYDVDRLSHQVDQLQEQYDQLVALSATADTRLEQFLRAVQAGGETHVSQHSLKQAGFAVEHLVTAVLAAQAEAKAADNG